MLNHLQLEHLLQATEVDACDPRAAEPPLTGDDSMTFPQRTCSTIASRLLGCDYAALNTC